MNKKGFTIIELLVVIAIISILAGMLLPAINQARKKAYSATCLSQMKQVNVVVNMYADTYDGWVIPASNEGGTNFMACILEFTNPAKRWDGNSATLPKILLCPDPMAEEERVNIGENRYSSYLWNGCTGLYASGSYTQFCAPKKIVKCKYPQDSGLMIDGVKRSDIRFLFYNRTGMVSNLSGRHSGTGNGLYLDGHVNAYINRLSDDELCRFGYYLPKVNNWIQYWQ